MTGFPQPEVFPTAEAIGDHLAREIAAGLRAASARGRPYVLGCPAGRTPLPVYGALAEQARGLDLSDLHLIMMDEFVVRDSEGWRCVPTASHFSCVGFALREILSRLPELPPANLHAPDPGDPVAYEGLIERLGGIDLFLLASGASDGHVAFNPPGSTLESRTRVVQLAEATREDNLSTFPDFGSLAAVPTHGVSVGLGTIALHSRAAVMILHGAHKAPALERLIDLQGFDPAWPASVVYACRAPRLVIDADVAAAASDALEAHHLSA
ncbi:MAG: 6-phosphogluconolactonase [Phenylobacterium sp.]|nr:6-phosphogluconolactonase [Phenylobacterium sp.]